MSKLCDMPILTGKLCGYCFAIPSAQVPSADVYVCGLSNPEIQDFLPNPISVTTADEPCLEQDWETRCPHNRKGK